MGHQYARLYASLARDSSLYFVIIKTQCIIKIFNETLTIFKGIKDIAENALEDPFFTRKEFYWEFHGGAKLK